jgi:hypothetical protein
MNNTETVKQLLSEIDNLSVSLNGAVHQMKLNRSALAHWGDKMSSFRLMDTNNRLTHAKERVDSLQEEISFKLAFAESLLASA